MKNYNFEYISHNMYSRVNSIIISKAEINKYFIFKNDTV